MPVELTVNGSARQIEAAPEISLLSALRDHLGLTGTKYGCGEGECGACTVLIDGRAVKSCITPLSYASGKHVTTIEGLEQSGRLHPVQEAFLETQAMQCAYCTPGMVMSAVGLLGEERESERSGNHSRDGRQHLPLRNLPEDRRRCQARGIEAEGSRAMMEPERYELRAGPAYDFTLDRRGFLRSLGGGLLIVGLVDALAAQESGGRRQGGREMPKQMSAWLHIGEDGRVTVYTGKAEVGQNTRTSLTQAIAEELRAPASISRPGDGRYGPGAVRHGNFREPEHTRDGAAAAQGGSRRAGDAARPCGKGVGRERAQAWRSGMAKSSRVPEPGAPVSAS